MSGPLAGIRILDLTSVVMGPYATQILGDYGADVIKIEPPEGDVMRRSGPMASDGMGHLYLNINRNKRSVVLDLKQKTGHERLLAMCACADVFVSNIRPLALERLGFGYDDVRAVAPQIVYALACGFGQNGPYAHKPAYDDLIQGMCGIPWLSEAAGASVPRYSPMVLVDRIVGLQLATAIASALAHRAKTGVGQRIDVPMYEGMLSVVLGEHLAGRTFDPAQGGVGYRRSLAPDRRPYQTLDGHICVLVYHDGHWLRFLTAIGRVDLMTSDARFRDQNARLQHIDAVYGFLSATLRTRSTFEWLALFEAADIPAAPMASIESILEDEHVQATGFVKDVDHPSEGRIREIGIPTTWSETPPAVRRQAPTLGEHTLEVLREWGISDDVATV